ncbi:MAG: hypothetical protein CEO12_455 [Parcubacteria group bacterium Gr01-1014_46]|nr:MAG: hypothetical protein CEO12_455 [Parcubacteria group bacterium Gr01-1014_46]
MEPQQVNPITEPTPTPKVYNSRKPSLLLVYLLFILIFLGLASWAGVYLNKNKVQDTENVVVTNEMDSWKTYRNNEYGFEFKYPEDWVEVKWGILTIDKDYVPNPQRQAHNFTGFCKIVFHDAFSEDSTIQDLIDNNYLSQRPSMTTEMLDNKKGTAFNYRGGSYKFFPVSSEKFLSVSLSCGEDVREKGEVVLSQILSTFKFIDKNDVSTWKTYRNEEYGFEFKYPQDWEVATSSNQDLITWSVGRYGDKSNTWFLFDFKIFINLHKENIDDFIKNYFDNTNDILKQENLYSGIYIEYAGIPGSAYFQLLPGNNKIILFESRIDINSKEFKQILSTFKFTNGNNTIALYPKLNWQKTVSVDGSSYGIFLDNYDYIKDVSGSKSNNVTIPVEVWVATTTEKIYSEFSKYYSDLLRQPGWNDGRIQIPSKSLTILPLTADGPLGSAWGYVNISSTTFRVIGLSYQLVKYIQISNNDEPIEGECPCEFEYRVFVSDDVDINTLDFK